MLPGMQRVQRVRGNEPSHSQMNSHCGSWSPKWTLKSSECDCRGQNPSVQRVFYIIRKLLKLRCLKWAHLTHLDISNANYERPTVKLTIWLPIIKSREQIQFPCVQVACNIPLESSRRELQLCFRPHRNRRSARDVMCPQSCRSPTCENFKTPTWESRDKMPFGCGPHRELQIIL
jgi:hypothetical protein